MSRVLDFRYLPRGGLMASINSIALAFSLGIYLPFGPYANMPAIEVEGGFTNAHLSNVEIPNSTTIELTTTRNLGLAYRIFSNNVYPWHYIQCKGYDVLEKTAILGGPGDSAYPPDNYTAGSTIMNLVANPYHLSGMVGH